MTLTNQGLAPILWIITSLLSFGWQKKQPTCSTHNWILSKPGHLSLCSPGGCRVRPRLGEQRQMGPCYNHPSSWATWEMGSTILCGILRSFFLNLHYLCFVQPRLLEQVLTLEFRVLPQRNAVALPATKLPCCMGGI